MNASPIGKHIWKKALAVRRQPRLLLPGLHQNPRQTTSSLLPAIRPFSSTFGSAEELRSERENTRDIRVAQAPQMGNAASHTTRSTRGISSSSREDDNRVVSILEDRDLITQIPLEDVRNFCFIAHIDAGKSSLSSRLLELCGNLGPKAQQEAWEATTGKRVETGSTSVSDDKELIEALDTLSVEQERGITVKASTATMLYKHPSAVGPTGTLLINMYDTPGALVVVAAVARERTGWFILAHLGFTSST